MNIVNKLSNKTLVLNPKSLHQNWVLLDASQFTLGRLASKVANYLIGKNKVEFSPNHNLADKVVIINAKNIKVTGNKLTSKIYYTHSNFPGGLKSESLERKLIRRPVDVIRLAVKGMLPVNRLRDERLQSLYIYEGSDHPHQGQIK
jgi:large subunit ribosomal protein L13